MTTANPSKRRVRCTGCGALCVDRYLSGGLCESCQLQLVLPLEPVSEEASHAT